MQIYTAMMIRNGLLNQKHYIFSGISNFHICAASSNCYRASIGRIRRERIVKEYKTILMRPDGSTVPARTNSEPKILVQLPVDLTVLSEEDRLHRLSERKKKVKVQKDDELGVTLDLNEYAELWKEK